MLKHGIHFILFYIISAIRIYQYKCIYYNHYNDASIPIRCIQIVT